MGWMGQADQRRAHDQHPVNKRIAVARQSNVARVRRVRPVCRQVPNPPDFAE